MVGRGRGARGRGQAGQTRREEPAEEAGAGAGVRVGGSVCGAIECWTGGGLVRPGLSAPAALGSSGRAPAAAADRWGGPEEARRARAPCARSGREAAGLRDAMSMEDPFFVVKG